MPFIRGIIFSSGLVGGCQALRDQLQLLHWGGLRLAVLQTEESDGAPDVTEGSATPQTAPPSNGSYGCEAVAVLRLRPLAAAAEGSSTADAAGAGAEAIAASWASEQRLQWPEEVLVLGKRGDAAGRLSGRLRERRWAQELREGARAAADGGCGGGGGSVDVATTGGGGAPWVLPGFDLDGEEEAEGGAQSLKAAPWQRLRLVLAHANLQRATEEAAAAAAAGAEAARRAAGGGEANPVSAGPPPQLLLVVGTAMKPSRERDLAREGLLNLVPQDGLVFAPLDLAAPLESQLPFHAILHKASDELELTPPAALGAPEAEGEKGGGGRSGAPRFGPRVRALAEFARRHPSVSVVDPLEAAAKVIDRTELARVCDSLAQLDIVGPELEPQPDLEPGGEPDLCAGAGPSAAPERDGDGDGDGDGGGGGDGGSAGARGGNGCASGGGCAKRRRVAAPPEVAAAERGHPGGVAPSSGVVVRAPRSTLMTSFAREEVAAAIGRLGRPPPYIVKPVVACGIPDSHRMALALTAGSLEGLPLPLPAVLQEFVNHDGTIFKVYVAGDKVFRAVRPSIPNLPTDPAEALRLEPSGRIVFDSLKSLPTSLTPPPPAHAEVAEAPGAPAGGVDDRGGAADATAAAPCPSCPPPAAAAAVAAAAAPCQAVLERLAAHLRCELGLSLFGFDVVIASQQEHGEQPHVQARGAVERSEVPQVLVVVDINYFPSFRGAVGAPAMFRQALRAAHERQQRRWRQQQQQQQNDLPVDNGC